MLTNNYSFSKCPKCEKSFFELIEDTPTNSNFKFMYLRCSSCKTIITAVDYLHTGTLIKKLAKGLNINLDNIYLP